MIALHRIAVNHAGIRFMVEIPKARCRTKGSIRRKNIKHGLLIHGRNAVSKLANLLIEILAHDDDSEGRLLRRLSAISRLSINTLYGIMELVFVLFDDYI